MDLCRAVKSLPTSWCLWHINRDYKAFHKHSFVKENLAQICLPETLYLIKRVNKKYSVTVGIYLWNLKNVNGNQTWKL